MKSIIVFISIVIIAAAIVSGVYWWQINQNWQSDAVSPTESIKIQQEDNKSTEPVSSINSGVKTFTDESTKVSFEYPNAYSYDQGLWTPDRHKNKDVVANLTHIPNIAISIDKLSRNQTLEEFIVTRYALSNTAVELLEQNSEGYLIPGQPPNYFFKKVALNGKSLIMIEGTELHTTTAYYTEHAGTVVGISTIFDNERTVLQDIAKTITFNDTL